MGYEYTGKTFKAEKTLRVGIIGYGIRIADAVLKELLDLDMGVELTAVCDIRNDEIKQIIKSSGKDPDTIAFYTDADEMLDKEKLDGVLIGTRCNLHSQMAQKVLKRNLPLFLEKPIATTIEDLLLLKTAYESSKSEVVVSFPLRTSFLARTAKEIIDSGKIGTVEHVQAVNNVPYGGVYFHNWYRDDSVTHGLYFAKTTHDFDYLNYLLGIKPVELCTMSSKRIFKGDKPAGLHCTDCLENESCCESPFYLKNFAAETSFGDLCCFGADTGNEDSGSVLIRYETGMHVCYSQNFFARKSAAARGAKLFGYKGTIEFDWYQNELKVYMHHKPMVEKYSFDSNVAGHFGGDKILAYNFINIMLGREKSISTMESGFLSTLMCFAAQESADRHSFVPVDDRTARR